ncbi:hypothetical protein PIB30_055957 [Stylosanthes scabra]|uniref:Uncharacterized protein n=1 Tax=Stylosanthes scabra TaxID=79078 RepID=A0ABU6RJI1_9FABA|nr:hypothetical protein [Stylosanthes scabra]
MSGGEDGKRDSVSGDGDRHLSSGRLSPRRRVLPFVGKPPILLAAVLPLHREDEGRTVRKKEEGVLLGVGAAGAVTRSGRHGAEHGGERQDVHASLFERGSFLFWFQTKREELNPKFDLGPHGVH